MASRPPPYPQRRKPGVGVNYVNRRQPLHRSESVVVPKVSETLCKTKTKTSAGLEISNRPATSRLNKEKYSGSMDKKLSTMSNGDDPGIPDPQTSPKQVTEDPIGPILVNNSRRMKHRLEIVGDINEVEETEAGPKPDSEPIPLPLTALQYLSKLRKMETSYQNGELHFEDLKPRLVVPNSMVFSGTSSSDLECNLLVENVSLLNVTYTIKSTCIPKFIIIERTGWIPPISKVIIKVKVRPDYVRDFADIAGEKFVIYSTPVFIEEQLLNLRLDTYWKAFGSELFPSGIAQIHEIKTLIPKNAGFSILDMIQLYWVPQKKKVQHNFEPTDQDTFSVIWELNRNIIAKNFIIDCQYREYIRNDMIRKGSSGIIPALTVSGIILFSIFLLFALTTTVNTPPFGLLGEQTNCDDYWSLCYHVGQHVQPLSIPWYENLYFWNWNWSSLNPFN